MVSIFRILAAVVVVVVLVCAALFYWASLGWDKDDLGRAEVYDIDREPVAAGDTLKVMSWNIGFGGGLTGSPSDRHPGTEVRENLSSIAATIRSVSPDVLFLQEVDRPSSRTGKVDQVEYLMKNTGMKHACFVATWKNNYVPFPYFPLSGHIGNVHSGQLVLSRFPIGECRRIPLPQPGENSWWYNRFFLHRALQHVILETGVEKKARIDVINVHLEAFSESNRREQATILASYAEELDERIPLVMAGDFNSLPPFAVKTRGFVDEDIDFTNDDTIRIVRKIGGIREAMIDDIRDLPEYVFNTYPATDPTRRLDYIFYRGFAGSVVSNVSKSARSSDHLPVISELRFK